MNKLYPLIIFIAVLCTIAVAIGQAYESADTAEWQRGNASLQSDGVIYEFFANQKDSEEKPFHIEAVYEFEECSNSLFSIEVHNAHFPLTWYELNESGQRVHILFNPDLYHFNDHTTYVVQDMSQHTDTIYIDFDESLAVNQVYPNPHRGKVHIEYSAMDRTGMVVHIVDAAGHLVMNQSFSLDEGEHVVTLNLDALQQGVYFMTLEGTCIHQFHKLIHLRQ
jgi:hypothetical protein